MKNLTFWPFTSILILIRGTFVGKRLLKAFGAMYLVAPTCVLNAHGPKAHSCEAANLAEGYIGKLLGG